jgi:hypothetical protein
MTCDPPERIARAVGALLVFLVFVVIGPPLGGIGLVIAGLIATGHWQTEEALVFVLMSYFFGGAQAAIVGLVMALRQYRGSRSGAYPVVIAASLLVGAGFGILVLLHSTDSPGSRTMAVAGLMLGIHVFAGLCSLAIARRMPLP